MIGCLVTIIVGTIVSFLTGPQNPAALDTDLLSPPVRYLLGEPRKSSCNKIQGITNYALELEDEKIPIDDIKSIK